MHGDAEHALSFRFVPRVEGGHVKVTVWAGNRDAGRGNVGELTFRAEEWVAFCEVLRQGAEHPSAETIRTSIPTSIRENPTGADYWTRCVLAGSRIVHVDATPFDLDAIDPPHPVDLRLDPAVDEYTRGYLDGRHDGGSE